MPDLEELRHRIRARLLELADAKESLRCRKEGVRRGTRDRRRAPPSYRVTRKITFTFEE
jgi:hypothetical protein